MASSPEQQPMSPEEIQKGWEGFWDKTVPHENLDEYHAALTGGNPVKINVVNTPAAAPIPSVAPSTAAAAMAQMDKYGTPVAEAFALPQTSAVTPTSETTPTIPQTTPEVPAEEVLRLQQEVARLTPALEKERAAKTAEPIPAAVTPSSEPASAVVIEPVPGGETAVSAEQPLAPAATTVEAAPTAPEPFTGSGSVSATGVFGQQFRAPGFGLEDTPPPPPAASAGANEPSAREVMGLSVKRRERSTPQPDTIIPIPRKPGWLERLHAADTGEAGKKSVLDLPSDSSLGSARVETPLPSPAATTPEPVPAPPPPSAETPAIPADEIEQFRGNPQALQGRQFENEFGTYIITEIKKVDDPVTGSGWRVVYGQEGSALAPNELSTVPIESFLPLLQSGKFVLHPAEGAPVPQSTSTEEVAMPPRPGGRSPSERMAAASADVAEMGRALRENGYSSATPSAAKPIGMEPRNKRSGFKLSALAPKSWFGARANIPEETATPGAVEPTPTSYINENRPLEDRMTGPLARMKERQETAGLASPAVPVVGAHLGETIQPGGDPTEARLAAAWEARVAKIETRTKERQDGKQSRKQAVWNFAKSFGRDIASIGSETLNGLIVAAIVLPLFTQKVPETTIPKPAFEIGSLQSAPTALEKTQQQFETQLAQEIFLPAMNGKHYWGMIKDQLSASGAARDLTEYQLNKWVYKIISKFYNDGKPLDAALNSKLIVHEGQTYDFSALNSSEAMTDIMNLKRDVQNPADTLTEADVLRGQLLLDR